MVEFLKEAARVVPSKRQLDWFEMERYAFVHYGVNTYTDREWGEGTEDEKIFNPTALDCDQWVEAVSLRASRDSSSRRSTTTVSACGRANTRSTA